MNTRYRGSQLALRRACGLAYEKSYVLGEEGLPSPTLQGGDNVHAAIKEAVRQTVEGHGLLNIHEIAYSTTYGTNVEYADALRVLTNFQEMLGDEVIIDPAKVFLLERELEMPLTLADGAEVVFFGTPDLGEKVDKRTVRIPDWKTHWQPETKEEFEADPQLKRYAMLVAHNYPTFERFLLEKRFVRYRNKYHEIELNRDDLLQVRLDVETEILITRMQEATGDFKATGGTWCAVCPHTASCPRVLKYREQNIDIVSIADDARARSLASDAMALDAAAAAIKNQLKRYLGGSHNTGYVPVSGGTLGYSTVNERYASWRAVLDLLAESSIEAGPDMFNVDFDTLDKLKKRVPETVAKKIDKLVVNSQGSRFQFRTSKATSAAKKKAADVPQELFS